MNETGTGRGFRWTTVVEAALFVGVLVVVNLLMTPDDLGYARVTPHPFWAVVLLLALRYPLRETLAATSLTSVVHAGLTLWGADKDYTFSAIAVFSDFRDPVLFLVVGGIVSAFTQRQHERADELASVVEERDRELAELRDAHRATGTALRELEGRIAGEFTGILDLFRELSNTRQMTVEQIRSHLLDVLIRYVHAEAAVFYEVEGNELVRRAHSGPVTSADRVRREEDVILDEAVRSTQVAHLGHFAGVEAFDRYQGGLLAGCLRSTDYQVLGVVAIERMPFVDYNPHTFKLFSTVLDWWGTVLEERMRLDELRRQSVFDDDMGLYNYAYFTDRQRQEFERARRFSLPMCLGLLRIDDFHRIPPLQQGRLKFAIAGVLRESISELEMAAHYRSSDLIAISFPIASVDDAEARLRAAVDAANQFYFTPYENDEEALRLSWSVAGYEIGMESAEELAQRAETGLPAVADG